MVSYLSESQSVLASSAEPLPLPERPAWLGNDLGVTDATPPPWTPVEVAGRAVRVTQREYRLADSGLPERLAILGQDVLTRPARLLAAVDGKPVTKWREQEEAWMEVAEGIRKVIAKLGERAGV